MDKRIIKFDDTEIEEYELHQCKSPILISDLDINEIVVSISFLLVNKILNISSVTKVRKKLTFMHILSRNEYI